jgi:hypothetical protein
MKSESFIRIKPPSQKSRSKSKSISIKPPDDDLPPLNHSDSPEQDLALPYVPTRLNRRYGSTQKSFASTKDWTEEITGTSTIKTLTQYFIRIKKELNDKRNSESENSIDINYRLKKKRDCASIIRSMRDNAQRLIGLPAYSNSSNMNDLVFKLQNCIIEVNNSILNINMEIQLNRPLIYEDTDVVTEELAKIKSGGKLKRRITVKRNVI